MPIVTSEKNSTVGVVAIAKPPPNRIDETFLDELPAGSRSAAADGCWVILLGISVRHFCAAADVSSI